MPVDHRATVCRYSQTTQRVWFFLYLRRETGRLYSPGDIAVRLGLPYHTVNMAVLRLCGRGVGIVHRCHGGYAYRNATAPAAA